MNASHPQPKIDIHKSADYRESYANSVQVRVSIWDFFLDLALRIQDSPELVTVENSSGVYLSPQQAKALWNMLGQNLAQYEQAFGTIALEPQGAAPKPMHMRVGPVH